MSQPAIRSRPGSRRDSAGGRPDVHSAAGCGPWSAASRRWDTMRSRCRPAGAGPARAWVGSDKVGSASDHLLEGSWCARPGRWPPPRPHYCSWLERGVVVELTLALAAVGGALGLGDGPAQRGSDLVALDLDHRALVALGGLPGPRLEPADDHLPVALGQGLGDVLGQLPPHIHPEEAG